MNFILHKTVLKIVGQYKEFYLISLCFLHVILGSPLTYKLIRKKAQDSLKKLEIISDKISNQLEQQENKKKVTIILDIDDFKLIAKHFWTTCEDIDPVEFPTITGYSWKDAIKVNAELQKGLEWIKNMN